jgi:GT2 family glycosyltransferase/tetratricopeptide (TPR) repeat protein
MITEVQRQQTNQAKTDVTIVIVTHNSAQTIVACLQSVGQTMRSQDEVVLVDNDSKDQTLRLVENFTKQNSRFRIIANPINRGYAAAANQGAGAGRNPYIVFLNPDTIVTHQWLERLVCHLQPAGTAAVGPLSNCAAGLQKAALHLQKEIGEDFDASAAIRSLRECNKHQSIPTKLLIGFCFMIKRSIFDAVGRLDEFLFLGNDDLDICWRLQSAGYDLAIALDTIVFHKGQESFKSEPKSITAGLVQESTDYLYYKLIRTYGISKVPSAQELWGIDWFQPSCRFNTDLPLTSIILLTWNQLQYTQRCIESVFKHTYSPFELIVVDNGSTDGTAKYLQTIERHRTACIRIKVIANSENAGFAVGCNQGLAVFRGAYAVLLNNDVVVTAGWLTRLVRAFDGHPKLGLVGPMTNCVSGPQRIVQPGYDTDSLEGLSQYAQAHAGRYHAQIVANWRIAGFCMVMRRSVIEKIGGLDERFAIGNFEDDDFCVRAHLAGFKAAVVKDAYVHHYGGRTFSGNKVNYHVRLNANWMIFKKKWNIPQHTPIDRQYKLPIPAGGFDAVTHHVSLKPYRSEGACSGDAGSKAAGSVLPVHQLPTQFLPAQMQTAIAKNKTSGGNPMSILDRVYEITKQQIAPDQKDVAIWILERICEEAYDHAQAHHELGLLCFERNEPERAQRHLEQAVSIAPQNMEFVKDLGDFFHVVRKDTHRALDLYNSVLQRQPDDRDTLLKAGHLHVAAQQFGMAREYYARLLALDPHHAEARVFLEKIEAASDAEAPQTTPEELYTQAHERLSGGDRVTALDLLDQVIHMAPQNALAHNDRGVLSYERNEKEKALYHYRQAVELAPDNITFLKNLADFYWVERKDAKKALEQYVQVLQLEPSDVETLLNCSQICRALNKQNDARDFLVHAQQIEPWNEDIGELLKALPLDDNDTSQPADRESLYQRAKDKAAAGDPNGAVADLARILQQEPYNALLHNDIGVLNYDSGNMAEALSCYEQAVAIAPDQALFKKNLADFYLMEQGRIEDAMKLYVSILEKDPQDLDCLLACGLVCIRMKKSDDARVFFERVLDIAPWNTSAKQGLEQLDDIGEGNMADVSGISQMQFQNRQMAN